MYKVFKQIIYYGIIQIEDKDKIEDKKKIEE